MSFFDEATYEEPSAQRRDDDAPLDVVSRVGSPASQGFDLAQLARLARELGPRDMAEINSRARQIGAELGRILDPNPKNEGTGAYYRWAVKNRDGTKGTIEGPTIGLMDALVEVWGRLVYQVEILEERGQRVTLRARVIDLVSLVIHERPYIAHLRPPPSRFASNADESERWRVMQLQSAESKAIRGVLERVVPQSVQHLALEAAKEAAAGAQLGNVPALDGQGKPILGKDGKPVMRRATLPEAIDAAVKGLGTLTPPPDFGLVERWLGRPRAQWVASDLAALRGLYARWKRGELTPAGFAAEVAEQEAASAGGAADEQHENGTGGDRLSGLGLGNTAGAPSPSTTSATGGSSAPAAGPAPSEGGGASPSTKNKPTTEGDAEVLAQVLAKAGGRVVTNIAKSMWREAMNLARVGDDRWNAAIAHGAKAGWFVATGYELQLPSHAAQQDLPPEPEGEPDAVDKMPDDEVLTESRSLMADLGEGLVDEAFAAAGVLSLDGASMDTERKVLRELLKRVPGGES